MPIIWSDAIQYSLQIIERNMNTLEDFPESCTGEQWELYNRHPRPMNWVTGFWTGLLWLAWAHSGDARYEAAARQWTARLAFLKDNLNTHDLGFIFMLSHGLGAQLSGDTSFHVNILQAAHNLRRRYNPKGGYLQAWGPTDGSVDERKRLIIDTMMNLPLLYWASAHTGDPTYARVATQHAQTSRLTLLRGDNSTAHVADFNPDTGAFLRRDTHQGYNYESCWSRGQAWTVYGFARANQSTGDEAFRAAAQRSADYAIQHAPDDLVPFWDYSHPDIPHTYRDSSAAAVLASGLLELAAIDPAGAARWQQTAEAILESLWINYSSRGTAIPAILLHGSRSVPQGLMDHALIYGDYYFFEALTKLARPDIAAKMVEKHTAEQRQTNET